MDAIEKFFEDQQWSEDDLKNTEWTRSRGYGHWYLGAQKNADGRTIDGKGTRFDDITVVIAHFDSDGTDYRGPQLFISFDKFYIRED